jgi:inosose dehydratase
MLDPDRIGHTGITWPGLPVEQAMADVASTGFTAFETMAHLFLQNSAGRAALERGTQLTGVKLAAAYCGANFLEPEHARADFDKLLAWGRALRDLGGDVAVIGPGRKRPQGYEPDDYESMANTLTELGRRMSDVGVTIALHPHTGTSVETPEEIVAVLEEIDPRYVGFGPDVGQIAKAGGDPLELVQTYRSLVRHIHIKDYVGGPVRYDASGKAIDTTGYAGYVPLGEGVVDLRAILQILDEDAYAGWLMVELDGTPHSPHAPKTAAAMGRKHLEVLMASINHAGRSDDRRPALGRASPAPGLQHP